MDLSLIKNIDFTNRDNILFLFIFLVAALIILVIIFIATSEVIRIIKKLIMRTFNVEVQKPKFDQRNGEESLRLSRDDKDVRNVPGQKVVDSILPVNFSTPLKKPDIKKDAVELQREIGEKNIAGSLSKLKFDAHSPEHTAMPGDAEGLEEKIPMPTKKMADVSQNEDQSMFKGRSEVSRITLKQELRKDPKIWHAAKQVGLTMSQTERSKLVKEVFSQTYGKNISKTDLKWGIHKLNKKMLGTKDIKEHAKLRKEIKFFKKIGGIKS